MTNEVVFVSMDFETTGLDPDRHGPLSVAFVNDEFQIYSEMNPGTVQFDPVALDINGFGFNHIADMRPVQEVDVYLYRLLSEHKSQYAAAEGVRVQYEAVGLNVGNFDMQFLRRYLPNTYKLFGHRPVELNSVAMTHWGAVVYKDRLKMAMSEIGLGLGYGEEDLHNALVDAEICWRFFVDYVYGINPEDDIPL